MKCSNYIRNLLYKIVRIFWCQINLTQERGLFDQWSTLDPKKFYAIPFPKLVFFISFYPEFLEKKKQRNKKKILSTINFLVNYRCFCFVFHANLMLGGKKEKTYIFVYNSINIVDKHVN